MRVIIDKIKINVPSLWIIFLLILPNISIATEKTDTLTLNIEWLPTKIISVNEEQGIKTLNAENAIFLNDYKYLPVISKKLVGKKILNVSIIKTELDSISAFEKSILLNRYSDSFPQIYFRTLLINGDYESEIFFFPFQKDSITGQIFKVKRVDIIITTTNTRKSKQQVVNRNLRSGSSVLSEGQWFKIAVAENGVYKLGKNELSKLGIDTKSLNPKKIKIYGNGGAMLPQENSAARIEDLYENSIHVEGENDGSFDEGDVVLFYGQSPHKISFDVENKTFDYQHNIYSDTTFYFVNIDGADGKRIGELENLGNSHPKIKTYDDLLYYEENSENLISSGREWFGEDFSANAYQYFRFSSKNLKPNSEIKFFVKIVGQTYEPTVMRIGVNDDYFEEIPIGSIPQGPYMSKGIFEEKWLNYPIDDVDFNEFTINLKFDRASDVKSTANLDYMNLWVKKLLKVDNEQLIWRSFASLNNIISTYEIDNASDQNIIWEITNPLDPNEQSFALSENKITFGAESDILRKYVLFSQNTVKAPILKGQIENQNIRGQNTPDLIIVSHPMFVSEAKRLANHRRSFNHLEVLVLTPQEIYNEFSSGSQDVTAIRDMVKYFYDKGNGEKLKNLLIFGRGSYDYKDRVRNNTNFVPIYQSYNSFHPVFSYGSDDYYAFMEEGEGSWGENVTGDHTMDIGVGRLPVKTKEEAMIIVDKLINYSSNPLTLGEWRNLIHFVADDGDGNIFQRDAEQLSSYIDTTDIKFNTSKIYLDAFEQISESNIEYSPEANEAIEKAIKKGGLIMNYIGHGSETRWCQETILDINMIREWENFNKLPLFVTATCEFGKHDDPKTTSGADFLLFNPNGGAIGLVTTSRPVFSNTNYDANFAFYKSLFEQNENGYLDLGTIFKNTKNRSLKGSNNRNFILLGDPSMKLAFPKENVKLLVDSEEYKSPNDTISGLEKVRIKGTIVDHEESVLDNFNGTVTANLFDKPSTITTYGNESAPMEFDIRNSLIFRGDATVKNGVFEIEFVTPKDLSEIVDKVKLSFYAIEKGTMNDAGGAEVSLNIGGPLKNEITDNTSPDITLFINDSTFENEGITSPDILALARIFDENGINILNNEDIQGVLLSVDGEPFEYVGDYFKAEKDNYKTGWLSYPVLNLEEGEHYLSVGAYDVNGNYAEKEIEFIVTSGDDFVIRNLYNYPNPVSDHTTFTFEHNRAGESLTAELQIFDLHGKIVYRHIQDIKNSTVNVKDIKWYGQNFSGKKLEPGVYMYVIYLRSSKDLSNISAKNKLLIIK